MTEQERSRGWTGPWVSQVRKGLLELLVLIALRREELYGYQLLQRLAELDDLALTESTLYPVLARLAADQLVAVRHQPSPAGPPRRYYRLTRAGHRRLEQMLAHWRSLNTSIERMATDKKGATE
ncbi:MAG: PadR family transcriptional regulator [Phycisphaerae bacterium]